MSFQLPVKVFLEIDGPCLIIPACTGVIYESQTGGMSCTHHSVEGFVVPLWHTRCYRGDIQEATKILYPEGAIGYGGGQPYSSEHFDEIERAAEWFEVIKEFRIHRDHPDITEAWIVARAQVYLDKLWTIDPIILTWENQD